jgi:2-polyprenyl-3-methyl-5-hydroxy-6-metoxy-1,4-benzoquinol methylase
LEKGAAARDIHDSEGLGSYDSQPSGAISPEFVKRELARVEHHRRGFCVTLETKVGRAPAILDVGCGTGGTTVALATCGLGAERVVGMDVNATTLEAASVRAEAYGLDRKVQFQHIHVDEPLPLPDATFDLVACVSVMEFIADERSRCRLVAELLRVTMPGGHVFLATPNPLRFREYHTRRWLGDWRRTPGYPWSSAPWSSPLQLLHEDSEAIPLAHLRLERNPRTRPVAWAAPVLEFLLPWQQHLVRRVPAGALH